MSEHECKYDDGICRRCHKLYSEEEAITQSVEWVEAISNGGTDMRYVDWLEAENAKLREGIMAVVKDWPEFEALAALVKEKDDGS